MMTRWILTLIPPALEAACMRQNLYTVTEICGMRGEIEINMYKKREIQRDKVKESERESERARETGIE